MPWTGSGSYTLPPAFSPEVNGTTIDATRYNGLTNDVQSGITAALAKNGENTPTANLPMGNNKHTGAAAANAIGQYLTYGQASALLDSLTLTTALVVGTTITATGNISGAAGTFTAPVTAPAYIPNSDTVPVRGTYGATDLKFAVNSLTPWSMVLASGGDFLPTATNTRSVGSASLELASLFAQKMQRASAGILEINSSNAAGIIALRTAGVEALRVDQFQRVGGSALHNNATLPSGTAFQYIASGTYTPTLTGVTNVSSATSPAGHWKRLGNIVHVGFSMIVNPTASSGITRVGVSLPIASNLTAVADLFGTCNCIVIQGQTGGIVAGDITNDRAQAEFYVTVSSGGTWIGSFSYEVK